MRYPPIPTNLQTDTLVILSVAHIHTALCGMPSPLENVRHQIRSPCNPPYLDLAQVPGCSNTSEFSHRTPWPNLAQTPGNARVFKLQGLLTPSRSSNARKIRRKQTGSLRANGVLHLGGRLRLLLVLRFPRSEGVRGAGKRCAQTAKKRDVRIYGLVLLIAFFGGYRGKFQDTHRRALLHFGHIWGRPKITFADPDLVYLIFSIVRSRHRIRMMYDVYK